MTATWKIIFWIWNSFFSCNFQNWKDFPNLSDTIISQLKWKIISPVWIFREHFITKTAIFFKKSSAKSLLPFLFALKDWDNCNALGASYANCSQLFHSWKLILNWFWKTMGEVDLDFKWAISLRKSIPPSKLFSRNWFSKAPQAFLMLNLSRKS